MTLENAYVACVFDSDSSFSLTHHKRAGSIKGFEYRVLLQLTWREVPETVSVMEDLRKQFGGSIIHGIEKSGFSKHTEYVKYRVGARQARVPIREILPYLRVKRRQAELCLEAATIIAKHHRGRWNPRPVEEWAELEQLHQEVGRLNWKNGKGRRRPIYL